MPKDRRSTGLGGLAATEIEEALTAGHAAVTSTSRFRLLGVPQKDIDAAHAQTRALLLAQARAR